MRKAALLRTSRSNGKLLCAHRQVAESLSFSCIIDVCVVAADEFRFVTDDVAHDRLGDVDFPADWRRQCQGGRRRASRPRAPESVVGFGSVFSSSEIFSFRCGATKARGPQAIRPSVIFSGEAPVPGQ